MEVNTICVVLKPISGPEGMLPSGTLVDPSEWRNRKALLTQRYLRIATSEEVASAVEVDGPSAPGTDIARPLQKKAGTSARKRATKGRKQ